MFSGEPVGPRTCERFVQRHTTVLPSPNDVCMRPRRKGDSFTTFDLGESIRAYNRTKPSWLKSHKQWLRGFMISEKDVRWCLRFVDPDG